MEKNNLFQRVRYLVVFGGFYSDTAFMEIILLTIIIIICKMYFTLFADCLVGSYLTQTFLGDVVCRACPDNSASTSRGSQMCECILGYFRNDVEDIHVPCTSKQN